MSESTRLELERRALFEGISPWKRLPFVELWAFWISAPAQAPAAMTEAVMAALDLDDPDEAAGELGPEEAARIARRHADSWRAWKGRFPADDYTAALGEWLIAHFFQIADRRPIRKYALGRQHYLPIGKYAPGRQHYLPPHSVLGHVARAWLPASLRPEDVGILKRHIELDEAIVEQCIAKAERSLFHYVALGDVVDVLNAAKQPLSGALQNWNSEKKSRAPSKRGRPRLPETYVRNGLICAAVEDLVAQGIRATRNDTSSARSACDAAAEAFCLSYRSVLRIWQERRSRA